MHINHSGANINIMCGGDTKSSAQNNFIFNHTAPINLNFYEEGKKKNKDIFKKELAMPDSVS